MAGKLRIHANERADGRWFWTAEWPGTPRGLDAVMASQATAACETAAECEQVGKLAYPRATVGARRPHKAAA